VAGADAHLLELLAHLEAGCAGRDDERRVTAALQLGLDRGDDHMDRRHLGDAAVRDPRLGAVDDPLVLGFVVHRARTEAGDVGTGVGLAHR